MCDWEHQQLGFYSLVSAARFTKFRICMFTGFPSKRSTHTILASLLAASLLQCPATAEEWPHWLGPSGDSKWTEPGTTDSTVAATSVFTEEATYVCDTQSSSLKTFDSLTGNGYLQTKVPTICEKKKGRYGLSFIAERTPKDHYFFLSATGDLIPAKLSSERYEELGRFNAIVLTQKVMGRTYNWSHLAFANQSISLHSGKDIIFYDLVAKTYDANNY